jgi:hypothetical protein
MCGFRPSELDKQELAGTLSLGTFYLSDVLSTGTVNRESGFFYPTCTSACNTLGVAG